MTYSLNTLNMPADESEAPSSGFGRFLREAGLIVGALLLVFWFLSLWSYAGQDAAWTSSGLGLPPRNWGGRMGALLSDICYFTFGFSAWWVFAVGLRAWLMGLANWMRDGLAETVAAPEQRTTRSSRLVSLVGLALLLMSSCSLEWSRLYRFESLLPGHSGGLIGYFLGPLGMKWLGFTGSGLFWIALGVLGAALVFRFSWSHLAEKLGSWIDSLVSVQRAGRERARDAEMGRKAAQARDDEFHHDFQSFDAGVTVATPAAESATVPLRTQPISAAKLAPAREQVEPQLLGTLHEPEELVPLKAGQRKTPHTPVIIEPTMVEVPQSERVIKEKQKPLFSEMPDSPLPQVDLLDEAQAQKETVSPETLEMTSRLIEKKLKDFGVQVTVVLASPGPVITRYEIEPATGVKGSQIVGLAKDLARSLSLVSIRVVETIPGKNYMALELPNARRQTIKLSEILGSKVYHEAKSLLTMGLGKDIIGNPVVADLAKMPHCLVAGTTGSGKSVGINAMILSLLYKAEARDVRLLMIDPKMLEMSIYEGIPHLLAPVVTDMKQAANGLNWCVAEMEKRYKLLSKMGVRNLAGFNNKIDEATAKGEFIYNPFSLTPEDPEPLKRLPHIVVVIDELADLMMVVGKKIEELIARLAQKARAAGIHLILATQRPSVDVITGLIKANIPTRIAFQVSSKIDSRTILDQMGAEALLGMGDMLYMPSGTGLPIRVHGAFVSDEEVHRVVNYLKSQGQPDYIEGVLEGGTAEGEDGLSLDGDVGGEKDPMYDQAVEVVLKNRKASISLVQRHLKIGYNRAARLVEDMEKAGLVSSMSGSGQREILVPSRAE
jgi:S-DNA-T family DNA segregation ATPase FtsK/SpoIIIE